MYTQSLLLIPYKKQGSYCSNTIGKREIQKERFFVGLKVQLYCMHGHAVLTRVSVGKKFGSIFIYLLSFMCSIVRRETVYRTCFVRSVSLRQQGKIEQCSMQSENRLWMIYFPQSRCPSQHTDIVHLVSARPKRSGRRSIC